MPPLLYLSICGRSSGSLEDSRRECALVVACRNRARAEATAILNERERVDTAAHALGRLSVAATGRPEHVDILPGKE